MARHLALVATLGLLAGCGGPDPAEAATVPADFTWMELDGTRHDFASLQGKAVFVNVWATWCPPCREEMPSIAALARRLADRDDVAFLVLGTDGRKEVTRYQEESGLDLAFQIPVDPLPPAFNSPGIPYTVLVDPTGRVVESHTGARDWNTDEIVERLESLAGR